MKLNTERPTHLPKCLWDLYLPPRWLLITHNGSEWSHVHWFGESTHELILWIRWCCLEKSVSLVCLSWWWWTFCWCTTRCWKFFRNVVMETNIWLKECSTVTMMSPSLVLRAVKMLYCIFTVSYHHLVRHILRSSLKHLFLSNRNLKAKVFAAVEQTKCFIILCISLTGLQQLHNVPFSVRAQILPLKYWSTSFFYSASLETLGKMRSVNT